MAVGPLWAEGPLPRSTPEAQGVSAARVQAFMDRAEREVKSISSTASRHPGSFYLLWDPRLAQGTERGMVEDDST